MKKRNGISYVVLAGVFLLLVLLNVFCLDHWLDSDMAAEMIFSRLLSEESRLFATPNWYYSTEFRILYTQLIMVPLFHVFGNWHVVRAITNVVFYALLFGSYCYMMKPLKVQRKWTVWTGIILLLPFSETLMTHMQMGNTYMSHVIIIFTAFGLFLRLVKPEPSRKLWKSWSLIGLYCGLSLICGMSGVRYMLALQGPLVIAALWEVMRGKKFQMLRREVSWENMMSVLREERTLYLYYALLGAVAAVAGYGINVLVIAKNYVFQTYESINFIAVYKGIFLERLQNTFGSLLQLFGYISNKGFLSLRGLVTMVAFVLVAMCVYFAVRSGKLTTGAASEKETDAQTEMHHFMFCFFVTAFVLNTFVFLFTNSTIVDRYYITVAVFVLPLIAIYFERETIPLDRLIAGIMLAGCLVLSTSKVVYSIGTANKNQDKQAVAAFLEENGYHFGYATYWNGNIITELTDGAVEIANVEPGAEGEFDYFTWSSPMKYYTPEYEAKASFLLLSNEEVVEFEECKTVNEGKVLYADEYYTVFEYEK